jgi:hypothetical protein
MGWWSDVKGDKAGLSIGLTKKARTLSFAETFERFDITTVSAPVKETLLIRTNGGTVTTLVDVAEIIWCPRRDSNARPSA